MLMKLGNNLRLLRAGKRLTQETLAEKVGVTRQTIISIEKGEYAPSTFLALKLARALGAPFEAVFFLEDEEI